MVVGGGNTVGDGPIRQEPTPASSAAIIDIRALEIECKRIVQEISEKFIDLGIEDHEDDYAADQLQAKQEKFDKEFSKTQFHFEAHSLSLPKTGAQSGNEDAILEKDDHQFEEDWPALGQALKDIHEILN
jgi:hypothetical protein